MRILSCECRIFVSQQVSPSPVALLVLQGEDRLARHTYHLENAELALYIVDDSTVSFFSALRLVLGCSNITGTLFKLFFS